MAEQNLVAVAAGLARTGKVPFATTYGVFATRRAYDFVAIAVAHSRLNVKIVAGLPGLTTGYGGTHQAIEDLALMRMIPGLVVIDPCDASETAAATRAIAAHDGPVYMRLLRGTVPVVLDPEIAFEIGKARRLRDGRGRGDRLDGDDDGAGAGRGGGAGGAGRGGGRAACADAEAVRRRGGGGVRRRRRPGGDGGEPCGRAAGWRARWRRRCSTPGCCRPLARIGLPDRFIECGSVPTLQARYGLTAAAIVEAAADEDHRDRDLHRRGRLEELAVREGAYRRRHPRDRRGDAERVHRAPPRRGCTS